MLVAESGQVQYFPGQSDLLQWGRDLLVAERRERAIRIEAAVRLQWGRDLLVAESNRLVLALAATQ